MGKRGCVMGFEHLLRTQADETQGAGKLVATNCPPVKAVRVRLSDITNMHQAPLPSRSPPVSSELRDAVHSVQKENAMLRKLLEERNKIIEVSSLELQKLRTSTQKLYAQNWQLAKANTLMLKELNLAKDKLKEQQHEYGCSLVLLKVKNCELEDKFKKQFHSGNIRAGATKNDKVSVKRDEVPATSHQMHTSRKISNLNRRHQSKDSSSVDLSTDNREVAGVEQTGSKRCRRSSNLTTEQSELSEDVFVLEDNNFPDLPLPCKDTHEDCPSVLENSSFLASINNAEEKLIGKTIVTLENDSKEVQSSVAVSFKKPAENVVLSGKKPIETNKRILTRRSSVFELEQPKQHESKIAEVNNAQCFTSETSSCAPNTDVKENQKEVGRRRSFRVSAQKVVSYKEKKITAKERRPD